MFNFPFKVLGWIIKASLFAGIVLILGSVLHIGGKTISDQVKTSLSHAEQIHAPTTDVLEKVKTWSSDVADKTKRAAEEFKKPARHTSDATPTIQNRPAQNRKTASEDTPLEHPRKPIHQGKITQKDANGTEDILASERQELRTLMRQLNNSTEKLTAN